MSAAMLAPDPKVGRQQPREIGEVVERGTANAPTALITVGYWMLSFEPERRARWLHPATPDVGADEIGELPVGSLFEDHDLLAGPGQHRCKGRTRRARADDDHVNFFGRHVTTSWSGRCAACMECRGRH